MEVKVLFLAPGMPKKDGGGDDGLGKGMNPESYAVDTGFEALLPGCR